MGESRKSRTETTPREPQNSCKLRKNPKIKKIKKEIVEFHVTEVINDDATVAEPSSGGASVEVAAVRKTIGARESQEEVVGATVDGGVSENKKRGSQRVGRRRIGCRSERRRLDAIDQGGIFLLEKVEGRVGEEEKDGEERGEQEEEMEYGEVAACHCQVTERERERTIGKMNCLKKVIAV